MINKLIHTFIKPRHPWRTIQFDELAEIYTSMSLRSLGVGIIGIFVPIYLYKNGVDLPSIFLFFTFFFLFRIPLTYIFAMIIGRIGPKHSIAVSNMTFVIFLSTLLTYRTLGWPLWLLALLFTFSNGLFYVSYHTDFSKIKDSKHGGKELGWLYIFERTGATLGPLIGGLVATYISPELTIVLSITVLLASVVPLFITNEPVRTHQKIVFRGFLWRRHIHDAVSMSAQNIEWLSSATLWPLYIGIAIFASDTYVKLGAILAIATGISMFSAHMFGRFIDSNRGRPLFQYGVAMNFLLYLARPFSNNTAAAVLVTASNEPVTLSYKMPLMKGFYDAADSEEGYRIVYLSWMEFIISIAKMCFCAGLYIAALFWDPEMVLKWSFAVAGLLSLAMYAQRFPALKKNK